MNKWIVILLFLGGCASDQPLRKNDQSTESSGRPAWVNSPYELCSESLDFCAVGESYTLTSAQSQARAELASIFRSKVSSQFESNSFTRDDGRTQERTEQMSRFVRTQVDEILVGSEIINSYTDDGLKKTFALAKIDRTKASRFLKKQMNDLDDQIEPLFKTQRRLVYSKLSRLMRKRVELNNVYHVLRGRFYTSPISQKQLENLRLTNNSTRKRLAIKVSGQNKDMYKDIVSLLKAEFAAVGHTVVNDEKAADQIVLIKAQKRKEFLKVEGFEKWSFTIHLSSSVIEGGKKGGIYIQESQVGRSERDAFEKLSKRISDAIIDQLDKLNI